MSFEVKRTPRVEAAWARTPLKSLDEGVARGLYNVARGFAGLGDEREGGSVGHKIGSWARRKLNIGGSGDEHALDQHAKMQAKYNAQDPELGKKYGELAKQNLSDRMHKSAGVPAVDKYNAGRLARMHSRMQAPPKPAAPSAPQTPRPASTAPAPHGFSDTAQDAAKAKPQAPAAPKPSPPPAGFSNSAETAAKAAIPDREFYAKSAPARQALFKKSEAERVADRLKRRALRNPTKGVTGPTGVSSRPRNLTLPPAITKT